MSLQILIILLASLLSSSSQTSTLNNGASLSAPQDFLTSTPNGNFTAGFYQVGENAYSFAIWFSEPLIDGNHTVVWMANRDRPVNGVKSKLSLLKSGNLVLNDAGQTDVWSTQTTSYSPVHLKLLDNGNLVLQDPTIPIPLWQSFDSPTDVLLPQQRITGASNLVSARSLTNHSSGFYKLFFDADNVLRLLYDGFGLTSVFWPSPWLVSWEAGRTTYNSSKTAFLNPFGHFYSSDDFKFNTADHRESIPRILKLDSDGNLRVYSLKNKIWKVTWQAISQTCKIHGICGVNSLCNYIGHSGTRKCSCLPGHRAKNKTDWAYGCEPEFNLSCDGNSNSTNFGFVELNHVEFYGYDFSYIPNIPLDMCREKCRTDCRCRGFEYNFGDNGINNCFHKALLLNGYRSPDFKNPTYLKVPQKAQQKAAFLNDVTSDLQCEGIQDNVVVLGRNYREKEQKTWVKSFLWFTLAVGVFEILCLITFWVKTRKSPEEAMIGYRKIADRFQKFSYAEMKKATGSFSEEIGRGSSGVVYKGKLPDNRIAAIKRLHEANYQGEEEFLAEMSTIGKLNNMNLIEIFQDSRISATWHQLIHLSVSSLFRSFFCQSPMAAWPPISSRSQPIDNTATNPAGNQTTGNTAPSSSTPTTGSNPFEQVARAEECHPHIILPTMGTIPLEAPEETPQTQSQSSSNNEQTDSHQLDEIPVQLSSETQSPDPDTSTSEQPWSPPMNTPPVSESPRQPPVVTQPVTRRSTRQKQTPNYLQDYICQNATVKTSPHQIEKDSRISATWHQLIHLSVVTVFVSNELSSLSFPYFPLLKLRNKIWGYCAEGKHRLLVYEYMENGSLAKNLEGNKLDWETRYEIAVGTTKGLAYLHEECLEWVLHCDVKPQNILLDSDFNPKVIDFGLSKLLRRDVNGPHFSRIRGTRGYMAPEWIYNLPITCKVDVYSYGIVLLEMITGKSPFGFCGDEENNMVEQRRLVSWVREKRNGGFENGEWVEEIVDVGLDGKYDLKKMEVLVDVALKCSEEDRDARPTMSQVVHMLLSENED
nr:putative receptor protein kinase ZmPK1 [Ipomoea batatas]